MVKKILAVIIVLGIVLAASPLYIKRGLYRNFANITDYQFFDNAIVKKGKPEAWLISSNYNKEAIPQTYLDTLEKDKSVAYLVIQNDSILYEKYWRGYSDSSLSGSFSMAKSVTSLLIGIAISEGKIKSVDDRISDYIPEFKHTGTDSIRIRDILTMSGGFKWTESYLNIFGKTSDIYYGDNVRKVVGNLKAAYAPGKLFYYSSAETQILGWILANVYGKKVPELLSEKIWSKIGAEHDALWSLDKAGGAPKVFCCLNSNARDFARLGKLVLQQGRWDSAQVVPANYIQEATTPASYLKDKEDGSTVDFYGFQFWIMHYKGLTIPYFRGVLGQFIYLIPEKNAVVVRLGEKVSKDQIRHHKVDSYMHIDAALKILK